MRISLRIVAFLILLNAAAVIIACDSTTLSVDPFTEDTADYYTVSFNSQFSNTESATVMPNPTSITVKPGETVDTLPTDPTMSDYIFGGWYTAQNGYGTKFTTAYKVTEDMTVYAYWYKYKVTFDSDGSTVSEGVTPPATAVIPTSTKTGYTFAGWWTQTNGGGTEFTALTPVNGNITVYAKWTQSTVYTVTYYDGSTVLAKQHITSPDTTVGTLPTNPTKLFYVFQSWNTDKYGSGTEFTAGTTVNESNTVDGNIAVYAQWSATPGYTITYNSGGGTAVEAQYIILPATNVGTLPTAPTKPCYTFAGWWTGKYGAGDSFTAGTTVTEDITVYANWTWTGGAAQSTYEIGDPGPSCVGKVFYVTDGGSHGFEAAPPNWYDWYDESGDPSSAWIAGDPYVDSDTGEIVHKTQTTLNGNTSTAIGTGLANSEAIINQVTGVGGTDTLYAAKLCRDYNGGGLSDWFLPSRDELAQLHAQRDVQKSGGFTDESYWSSSESGIWDAYTQNFKNGQQNKSYKSFSRMVRPVRAF